MRCGHGLGAEPRIRAKRRGNCLIGDHRRQFAGDLHREKWRAAQSQCGERREEKEPPTLIAHLLAVLEDLDLVGGAGGLVVEVGGPLAAAAEVLVVEEAVDGVALLRRAHHGHHRVVPLALPGRGLKVDDIVLIFSKR